MPSVHERAGGDDRVARRSVQPFSRIAPIPTRHRSSIVQPCRIARVPDGHLVADDGRVRARASRARSSPSWMFVRRPMRMRFTSPRMTTFIQTLLSAPISTSPMTCADSSTKADGSTRRDDVMRSVPKHAVGSSRFQVGFRVPGCPGSSRANRLEPHGIRRNVEPERRTGPRPVRSSAASRRAAPGTCPSCPCRTPRTARRSGRTAPARCPRWRRSSRAAASCSRSRS